MGSSSPFLGVTYKTYNLKPKLKKHQELPSLDVSFGIVLNHVPLKVRIEVETFALIHKTHEISHILVFSKTSKITSPLQTIHHHHHQHPPQSPHLPSSSNHVSLPKHHPKPRKKPPVNHHPPGMALNGGCKGFKASHSVRLNRPEARKRRRMSSKSAVLLASCACCKDAAQAAASWRRKSTEVEVIPTVGNQKSGESSPVEVGRLSHYLRGFKTIPHGCLGKQPSTISLGIWKWDWYGNLVWGKVYGKGVLIIGGPWDFPLILTKFFGEIFGVFGLYMLEIIWGILAKGGGFQWASTPQKIERGDFEHVVLCQSQGWTNMRPGGWWVVGG